MSPGFHQQLARSEFGTSDNIEPGEEFAPSADAHEIPPRSQLRSGKKPARKKPLGDDISDVQIFFWCFFVILSGVYFVFWRQEKFIVGFCGVHQSERPLPVCC